MTVYKLLEILNGIKNKDLPIYIGRDISELYAAKEAMAFPDDVDPDDDEGAHFQICAQFVPDEGNPKKIDNRLKQGMDGHLGSESNRDKFDRLTKPYRKSKKKSKK